MNLDRAAIVLRPRTVAEVVDLAFRLTFSLAAPVYLKLSVWVLTPVVAGTLALKYALKWDWWAVWIVAILAANLMQGVFTVAAGRLLFSEEVRVIEVLRGYFKRFGSYFFTLLVTRALLVLAGLMSFFVALPFAWPPMVFVHEAVLLEGADPFSALGRASKFVAGRTWSAFGLLMILLCGQIGAVLIAEILAQSILDDVLQLGTPAGSLFKDSISPFAVIGLFASVPFVSTARFLQYIDTRTRADGWDIQVRFLAIASKDENERRLAA